MAESCLRLPTDREMIDVLVSSAFSRSRMANLRKRLDPRRFSSFGSYHLSFLHLHHLRPLRTSPFVGRLARWTQNWSILASVLTRSASTGGSGDASSLQLKDQLRDPRRHPRPPPARLPWRQDLRARHDVPLAAPEVLEPVRRQFGVAGRVLDVLVPDPERRRNRRGGGVNAAFGVGPRRAGAISLVSIAARRQGYLVT